MDHRHRQRLGAGIAAASLLFMGIPAAASATAPEPTQVAVSAESVAPLGDEDELHVAALRLMTNYMRKFKGTAFYKVIRVGRIADYRSALAGTTVVIDPVKTAEANSVALYDPFWRYIYLSEDPTTIKGAARDKLAVTIWHEVGHAIEDLHGDFNSPNAEDDNYKERQIEYMDIVLGSALPMLEYMEKRAKKGASVATLNAIWKSFLRKMAAAYFARATVAYPVRTQDLKSWFGFDVNVLAIAKKYASGKALPGKAGRLLKSALRYQKRWTDPKAQGLDGVTGLWQGPFYFGGIADNRYLVLTRRGKSREVRGFFVSGNGSISGDINLYCPEWLPNQCHESNMTLTFTYDNAMSPTCTWGSMLFSFGTSVVGTHTYVGLPGWHACNQPTVPDTGRAQAQLKLFSSRAAA